MLQKLNMVLNVAESALFIILLIFNMQWSNGACIEKIRKIMKIALSASFQNHDLLLERSSD